MSVAVTASGGPRAAADRLDFVLPEFTRHSWASEQARQTWEPRLRRIQEAWAEVEWRSILEGVRRCALVGLTARELAAAIPRWSAHQLSALGLPIPAPVGQGAFASPHQGSSFAVVGAALDEVTRAQGAWVARDDDALGRLLGYPECCRRFFAEVWTQQRALDTTWGMATGTLQPRDGVVVVEPSEAALTNVLWRWLGVRAVPHLPCRFDCQESLQLGERLLGVAARAGHAEEAAWIREILSWPVEWSALHGIAEVNTPILKLTTRTDATASKYVVRWKGTRYPSEGAAGLRFPYQAPTRPLMTEGRNFQLRPRPAPAPAAIDWSRLAEPQADHYDSDVILRLAETTVSAERPQPYRRTPVGDSPSLFDGQVAVRHACRSLPAYAALADRYLDAPADHPNLGVAAEHVRRWPAMFAQCQRLLEAIHPALDVRIPFEATAIYRGSSCHSYEPLFGVIWATIFCPLGLAEGIVHELGHQKLRALGVSLESATAIVGNDPTRRYVSPIIKDRERPMTAVLHAQYSYVHVAALDLHMLEAEPEPARREALAVELDRNLSRIEEGRETLRVHFEPGEHGREFMTGLVRWTDAIIDRGRALLAREASARPARPAALAATAVAGRPLPVIDTSTSVIVTPDREIEVLAAFTAPRIVVLGNVLSGEECDALVAHCASRLARSPVIGDAEGTIQFHENRTSSDTALQRGETALIARIEARLAALTSWPVECSEGLGVVRYQPSQEYRPHNDWIDPNVPGLRQHLESGGQRLATLVVYLNDVEAGGETWFPEIGLRVMPRKGGAVFFVNTDAAYVPDPLTLHAGCPVVTGVKYVANKWLRERPC